MIRSISNYMKYKDTAFTNRKFKLLRCCVLKVKIVCCYFSNYIGNYFQSVEPCLFIPDHEVDHTLQLYLEICYEISAESDI